MEKVNYILHISSVYAQFFQEKIATLRKQNFKL